ncbi:hypothetical protein B0H14DRAFT_3486192 [Mycena olivaceomarginata]|nr:hypothetical protein B0H14DRAFT_3486192 [Mycena olivaceomarginata]
MYQLLNRASHVPSGDSVCPEMQQDIVDLEKRCTDRAIALVKCVDLIFKGIAAEVGKAVNLAEKRSPSVFEKISGLKWNQYLMRRQGEYGPSDLNAVQTEWHLGVNVKIPALNSVFFQELEVDLANSIENGKPNMTFIRDSAHAIFESLKAGIYLAFGDCVDEVQTELLGGIKRILREINLLFVGFGNTDSKGFAQPPTILPHKEDQIFDMTDSLKSRCQEIELHLSP